MKLDHEKKSDDVEAVTFAILIAAIAALALWASEASGQEPDRLDAAIRDFIAPAPRHRLHDPEARAEVVADVNAASATHYVPPALLLTVAICESSLSPSAVGAIGEIGIVQVHGAAAVGCDLTTQLGQLLCGASWLRHGYDRCGSWCGALTAYATGRCRTKSDRVRRLVNYRLAMWRGMEE